MTRIIITSKPPIEAKHEVEIGNEYDAQWQKEDECVLGGWIIEGNSGEKVKILPRECEVVK